MLALLHTFNLWRNGTAGKTTVVASDMNEALDRFCARLGYIDHADYCQEHGLTESDIHIEEVGKT
ncbi:hypothetical protein V8Z80_08375 [Orrella sp. JC864]|uniref:hypothetical protein n=1 Tax=Orrella sp. JC864 TaxID=3120298 RepID=UPI0030098724